MQRKLCHSASKGAIVLATQFSVCATRKALPHEKSACQLHRSSGRRKRTQSSLHMNGEWRADIVPPPLATSSGDRNVYSANGGCSPPESIQQAIAALGEMIRAQLT